MFLYVNGEKIEPQRIEAEIERLRPEYERVFASMESGQRESQLAEWSKENLIEAVLLRQVADKQIESVSADELDNACKRLAEQAGGDAAWEEHLRKNNINQQQLRCDVEQQLKAEKLVEEIAQKTKQPSEKEIGRYYQDNRKRFEIPEMVRAAHIVRHPNKDRTRQQMQQEMEDVLKRLRQGEDFAQLAQNSDCPDRGGDLGYFARGQMVEEFEQVVFNLEIGQVSDIFETQFGLHIAKVLDKRQAVQCPLEQVREVILKDLREQARQKALERLIDAERAKAIIEERPQ